MCSTKTFLGQEIFLEKDIKICVSFLLKLSFYDCDQKDLIIIIYILIS